MRIACRELSGWFAQSTIIVTPTPFLARIAREQLARERRERGFETWERPGIYGLEAWLAACWREVRYSGAAIPSLLSPAQERALWHNIIEQEHPQLFDVSATVPLAQAAAGLLAQWHIPAEGELWNEHADAQQFQRWYRLLRRQCRDHGWITRRDLPASLATWMAAGQFQPQTTVFVGFENHSPALESVFAAMGGLGVRLPFDHAKPPKKAIAKSCETPADELDYAARRLRYLFEEKPGGPSLALFVPGLAEQHALVERTIHAVFFPSTATDLAGAQSAPSLFRLSAAGLLIDQPLVASALLLLQLAFPRIDHAEAGVILRSPFITGAFTENHLRALADIELRRRRELDFSLHDIERASRACPILSSCWRRLAKLLPKASQILSLSEWSEFISDLLVALGWPGDRELTPAEERIAEQWKAQLSELSSLGLVSSPVTFEAALAQLRRLLSTRLEHGDGLCPIQILDAGQALGVACDAAVVVGLSEETWPPPVRISPLVPLKLQRLYRVPGSTPLSVREERARMTQSLFESSPEMLVTFNDKLASIAENFVAKKSRDLPVWEGRLPQQSFPAATLEVQLDGQAPAFVATGEVRGGTGIIKAQSQCPFQAFAKYRLHARRPEDASFGFDALDRGSFVHKALENVWRRLESQSKLLRTSPTELRALVNEAIAEAVEAKDVGLLHRLSVETERTRLEELILDWLDVERNRHESFTVETVEGERKFEVPGLSVSLRVDRIDRLKSGNLVLIDYKSGKQTRPKLAGERPAEPQLLVYAASVDSPVDGVFFGQLRPREVKAVGFSRTKQFKGQSAEVKKDWDAYIESSRDKVEKLASEFVRGVAEVRPTGAVCEYCGMKPFCRVNERGVSLEEEE